MEHEYCILPKIKEMLNKLFSKNQQLVRVSLSARFPAEIYAAAVHILVFLGYIPTDVREC